MNNIKIPAKIGRTTQSRPYSGTYLPEHSTGTFGSTAGQSTATPHGVTSLMCRSAGWVPPAPMWTSTASGFSASASSSHQLHPPRASTASSYRSAKIATTGSAAMDCVAAKIAGGVVAVSVLNINQGNCRRAYESVCAPSASPARPRMPQSACGRASAVTATATSSHRAACVM